MKTIILSLLFLPLSLSNEPITKDCKCLSAEQAGKDIPLWGKVEVVSIGEDFRVKVVTIDPDLLVDTTGCCPTECGEWQFVDCLGDFTIRFVNIDEDFSIQYSSFPGLP